MFQEDSEQVNMNVEVLFIKAWLHVPTKQNI
jgi:hypothetical protein